MKTARQVQHKRGPVKDLKDLSDRYRKLTGGEKAAVKPELRRAVLHLFGLGKEGSR
jgi:hypothetical protein